MMFNSIKARLTDVFTGLAHVIGTQEHLPKPKTIRPLETYQSSYVGNECLWYVTEHFRGETAFVYNKETTLVINNEVYYGLEAAIIHVLSKVDPKDCINLRHRGKSFTMTLQQFIDGETAREPNYVFNIKDVSELLLHHLTHRDN